MLEKIFTVPENFQIKKKKKSQDTGKNVQFWKKSSLADTVTIGILFVVINNFLHYERYFKSFGSLSHSPHVVTL